MQDIHSETNSPATQPGRKRIWLGLALFLLFFAPLAGGAGLAAFISGNYDKLLQNGQAAFAEGDWTSAVSSFDQALNVQPAFLQRQPALAQGLRGVARYRQNSLSVALADLDAALTADGGMFDLYAYRADIHFRQGNTAEALRDAEAALNAGAPLPDHLRALLAANQTVIYYEAGDWAAAQQAAAAGLRLAEYLTADQLVFLQAIQAVGDLRDNGDEEAAALAQLVLTANANLPDKLRAELLAGQAALFYARHDWAATLAASEAALTLADALSATAVARLHEMRTAVYLSQDNREAAVVAAELAGGRESALYLSAAAWQAYRAFDEETALTAAEAALSLDEANGLAYRVRGMIRFWQGAVHLAIADLERALALDSQDAEAAAMLTKAYLEIQETTKAEAAVAQAVAAAPNAPATLWAQANWRLYNRQWLDGRAYLDAAIALDQSRPEFYSSRAESYVLTSEFLTLAPADIDAALALNPSFAPALLWRAQKLIEDKEEGAGELLTQLLEMRPDWYAVHIARFQYLIVVESDEEEGLAAIARAIELFPERGDSYVWRGLIYLDKEEWDLAEADFDRALTLSPGSALARMGLARLAVERELYDEALALLDEASQLFPEASEIGVQKARLLYGFMDDLAGAWELIHEVVARNPQHGPARILQASLYASLDESERALEILGEHLTLFPNSHPALELRAHIYLERNRLNAAKQDAQRVAELVPEGAGAYYLLALIAVEEGRWAEVQRQARKMLEYDPQSADAYYLLGLVAFNNDDWETAVAVFDEALAAVPDLDLFYFLRGLSHASQRDREQAEADILTGLELSTDLDLIVDMEQALVEVTILPDMQDGKFIYINEEYGFTIAYSPDWKMEPLPADSLYEFLLVYETPVYYAQISAIAFDGAPARMTAREFFNAIASDLRTIQGFTSIGSRNAQINGFSTVVHDYELAISGMVLRGRQYFFVSRGTAVIFGFETMSENFEDLAPEFEEIIATFTFVP